MVIVLLKHSRNFEWTYLFVYLDSKGFPFCLKEGDPVVFAHYEISAQALDATKVSS